MNKRVILPIAMTMVLFSMLALSAKAVTVGVDVFPEKILPGATSTITVTLGAGDPAGTGSVTVITPVTRTVSSTGISVPSGGSDSVEYPTDFPGGSTTEMGEYDVIVALTDAPTRTYKAVFWVSLFVIPESPIGTLLGIIAPTAAVVSIFATKRLRSPKHP